LIGTTDKAFDEKGEDGAPRDAAAAQISPEEIEYLIEAVNASFEKQISADDIVWSYSGVRSLVDDGNDSNSKVTRDYKLLLSEHGGAPILSVFGGKITTYRALAEDVMGKVILSLQAHDYQPINEGVTPSLQKWTADTALPGGDMPGRNFDEFLNAQKARYKFLPKALLLRYARAYGTRMDYFLSAAKSLDDLGAHYGDDVYEAELKHLIAYEFAQSGDDVLWRRSKLGLHVTPETAEVINLQMPILYAAYKQEAFV